MKRREKLRKIKSKKNDINKGKVRKNPKINLMIIGMEK